jgi:NADPH2:quinone reductase
MLQGCIAVKPPQEMNAIDITSPGGPEVLKVARHSVPVPGEHDVLIKVAYGGVNRPDCLQRMGAYPPPPGAPKIPGLEISGTVEAAGSAVDDAMIGRKVMALVPGGGYGEYVCAHQTNTLAVPKGLSMAEAACIPETFFTVWHNVFQRGGLKAGEVFLVHGGTSGIGTTAIQLAKAFGAKVIATAGSREKCEACVNLGADLAINYREADFVAEVRQYSGGRGTDLILDMVGGSYIERNYDASAEDGRIVQIAFLGGPKAEVNFAKLMMKRLTHTGSTLRARSVEFKAQIARELEQQVWPLIEAGKVRPVMHAEFALADAAKAHGMMESGEHIGKIVLKVS